MLVRSLLTVPYDISTHPLTTKPNHVIHLVDEQANLLAVILRSAEEPTLNRPQLQRVARAARAHQNYIRTRMQADDSDDDEGPEDDDGWLFEDLGVLIRLYARLRDREQMIELIFEVRVYSTPRLLPVR